MAPPGLDTVTGQDPVQAALASAFSGLQSTGAQGPTPAAAEQVLPVDTPAAEPLASQAPEMATPDAVNPLPPPNAPPQAGAEPAQEVVPGGIPDDDAQVESQLLKNFDIKLEDIVPKDVLDSLYKTAKGGMTLPDALGIVSIAVTNPELAGQLLLQHEREKYAATNSLVNISSQIGSSRKEAARQVSMYMRARKDARYVQAAADKKASDAQYLERSKAVTAFGEDLRKGGLDLTSIGIEMPDEATMRDPVAYAKWVQGATAAAGNAQGKQQFLQEIAGMSKTMGPAALAAKTGVDPTAGVTALAQRLGFTPEEMAQLQPVIQGFAKAAKRAVAAGDADTAKALAASRYLTQQSGKIGAEIKKIEKEVETGIVGMKPEKAIQLTNTLQMLAMTTQSELQSAMVALAAEMRKPTPEDAAAAAGDYWPGNEIEPDKIQNPQLIDMLQKRVQSANMGLMNASQLIAQLQPIATGQQSTLDMSLALQDAGPKLAEASRTSVLSGAALPPGLAPDVRAEAQAAAMDPASWLAYLKQPPIGPNGQPNPIRTAYWASVVRRIGDAMGGAQSPQDIIRLLDAQQPGQPSYADQFAGQDITLPEQPIEAMMGALQPGAQPQGAGGPEPSKK